MRATRDLLSPLGVALALTGAVLFFGGGSGTGSLPWIGGAAVLAAVAFAVTRGLPPGWPALVPLAALALWCALSVAWSDAPDRSWDYANRTLVYVAFAVVGSYVAPRTRELAVGFAVLLGAVVVWALLGKVLPWLYEDYGRIARLRAPVGYWNGLALLGDVALPLGLWLALRRRAAGTLLVYGWLVALGLTLSRGGAIVAVLVVAAWLALSRAWLSSGATLVAAGLPAAAVVGISFALDGITNDGASHPTRVRDGLLFGAAVAVGAVVAALLARAPRPAATPRLRRVVLAVIAVVVAAAIVAGGFHARSWWDSFTSSAITQVSNSGPGRFGSAGSNFRWVWWKQAWHGWEDRPLAGNGAGAFRLTNLRYRGTYLDTTTEPHDLPLQFLSETGVVGLALFAAAMGTLLVAGWRRRPQGAELALWLALPAYLVHALIDIDWDFASVTAPVLLVAGAVAVRPAERREASPFAALAGAGVALAVLSSLFAVWLGSRWAGEAQRALDRPAHAVELARRARSVNPLTVDPLFTQALAEQLQRHDVRALGLLRRATEIQPKNPQAWYLLGAFLADAGCPHAALPALERFTELNPQDRGGALYNQTRDAVNAGKARC